MILRPAARHRAPAERPLGTAVLLALLAPTLGCDDSSPTEPEAPAAIAVTFVRAESLAVHHELIRTLLEDTAARAGGALALGPVEATVTADAGRTIPGWGIGGYTLGPRQIEIVVDPSAAGLADLLQQRLPHIVAHELHHAVRWRNPGPYVTLLEALVTEGLADHFANELLGTAVPPWSRAFPPGQTELYLERARPELDRTFDFAAWFFGIGTDLPRWTGYTLGYRLVDDYLAANPGSSAAGLVDAPADLFRPES